MDNYYENEISYKLKRFNSSSDNNFNEALRIYTSCISREVKTNTNEITHWIDQAKNKTDPTELLFFGFFSNDIIIGYAEIAYIRKERLIIIDYMVVDSKYMSNSSFSTFLFLLLGYFIKNDIDYDYIITEILVKYNDIETKVDIIRLFENENFKIINALYIQPSLETNNLESNKEALLMIYQRNCTRSSIKKETYFRIVNSIYFDHYCTWDAPFFSNEQIKNNYSKLMSDFEKIKSSTCQDILSDEEIKLNGYKNKLISNNTLPPVSNTKTLRSALIYTFIAVILIMLILFFLKELKMELITISTVTITILFILFSFLFLIDPKSTKLLNKIPLLSKIIKVFGK